MHGLISTHDELQHVLADVAQSTVVAIDTEADSLHSYFEKLCLVQVSTVHADYLIDPLAGMDLQPLLTEMQQRQTIFHGADFDLRMLRRAGTFEPQQMFDTMIAARLLGRTEFSLAALVKAYFGVEMVKASQKADWSRRPLTENMAEYARNDTHYLIRLAEYLGNELHVAGRTSWNEQSCERALMLSKLVRERDYEELWRIKGSSALRGRAAAILRELWQWRDNEAQRLDRPAFKVLRNEDLIMVAAKSDGNEPWEIHHLRGSRRQSFIEAVQRGMNVPQERWPQRVFAERTPRDLEAEKRVQKYRIIRDKKASELSLDPSLIANKSMLEMLGREKEKALELMMPWQRELMGLSLDSLTCE